MTSNKPRKASGSSGKSSNNGAKQGKGRAKSAPSALRVVLIILAILVGIGVIFSAINAFVPQLLGGASLSGKLAVEVNGQPITMAELDDAYSRLPYQYQLFLTKEQLLGQLIDQMLLRQEAARQGIEATDFEAEENIKKARLQSNISDEEFQSLLDNRSLDYNELVQLSKDQILVETIISLEVTSKVNVTTEEALTYYNDNSDSFRSPPVMTVRHILVATQLVNRTDNESLSRAEEAFSKVDESRSNFCALVTEYTDDTASADTCGEYEFTKGQLPEQFESWAGSAAIGEVGLVNTEYGSHVMWLVNKTPEGIVRFEDAQEQIVSSLELKEQKALYQDLIAKLRSEADIKDYLTVADEPEAETAENEPVITPPEDIDVVEPIEEPVEAVEPVEEPVEIIVPEEEELVPPVVEAPVDEPVDYAACLGEKGATLYGANWNSDTARQIKLLGEDAGTFKYYECAVEGDYRAQTAACALAGIKAYPTWVVNNEQYMGVYGIEELAKLAGC